METTGAAEHCTGCGKPLHHNAPTVVGVLTPPPPAQITSTEEFQSQADAPVELTQMAFSSTAGARRGVATNSGPTGILESGLSFGTRYHVIRPLGVGGMGAVYQAWDGELGVAVALKVIRPDLSLTSDGTANADAERRFKRELLLARQVTHKNVVRIHDLGEIDGIKYITMPYIQGRDLAAVLTEAGRLPVANALAIARQIVAGLQAAHEVGVVHRDLKPANIMIDEDRALIMDFGIARSTVVDGETMLAGGTMAGAVVGTLEYMAPEQGLGESVDQRADIYAFGLILYDMLVGRRQTVVSQSSFSDLMRRMQNAPPSVRSIEPTIPEALDRLISRCLLPDPAARYQTSSELGAELDLLDADGHLRPGLSPSLVANSLPAIAPRSDLPSARWLPVSRKWMAAVVVVVAAVVGVMVRQRTTVQRVEPSAAPSPPAISLAVLPFRNASPDKSIDWLGPNLAEMLRTEIGQSAHLRSISSDRLGQIERDLHIAADSPIDAGTLRRLAEFSNAETILWGQYVKLGDAIRIDATLEDMKHQRAIPLKVEAANQPGLFAAVAQLAQSIRQNLALSPDIIKELQQKSARPSTQSLEALRYYNEGLQFARQGKHSDAQKAFQASTERDKDFALAYSKLGQSYANLGYDDEAERVSRTAVELSPDLLPQERYLVLANHARLLNDTAKAIESYENLVKVSPEDPEVHFNLASLYEGVGSFDLARDHYQKVLTSDPNYVDALFAYGRVEIKRGNPQGSLEHLTRALTLAIQLENEEAKANLLNAIGVAYKRLNKADEALRYYEQSLEIKRARHDKRGIAITLGEIAQIQESLGKPDQALASYTEALRLQREIGDKKGIGGTLNNLGLFRSERAQYDEALKLQKEALQIEREIGDKNSQAVSLNNIGTVYSHKGEFDDARTYFERALALHEELKVPGAIADTLHNLAETSTKIGRNDEALNQYLRALNLRRSSGDKRGAAIESYSLGTVFEQQGRYGAALKSKEEALKGFRDLQDRGFWLGEILSGYGHTLGQSGRNPEAEKALNEALDVARANRNKALIAQALNFLGDNAAYRGDFKAAASLFEQALKEASQTTDRHLVLLSKSNVERALLLEKRASEIPSLSASAPRIIGSPPDERLRAAVDVLGEVRRDAERLGFKYLALECSIGAAEASLYAGDVARAQRELARAAAQSEKLGLRPLRAEAEYLLSAALSVAGKQAEAARHASEAGRLLGEIRDEMQSDLALKRADLAPMLRGSPPGATPQKNN